MATPQMKAQTVLWYAEFKSIVQREFRRVFNHDAPTARSIKKWHDTFLAVGLVGEDRDLTPLDFFLWGYVKDIKFTPPQSETFVSAS